jgi:hypothetical protein
VAALLAGLDGVNLAVGELALLNALVGLAVLAETVVLCDWLAWVFGSRMYQDGMGWVGRVLQI